LTNITDHCDNLWYRSPDNARRARNDRCIYRHVGHWQLLSEIGAGLLWPARAGSLLLVPAARPPARLPVPLSVLDLCPVPAGAPAGQALHRAVDAARQADRLGFTRFWVAEHHNLPGIASAAPAVLAGQIASATTRIRVGSGGVLLPNHPPLTVAEQFGTLEALHPGRIDLGLGRAPGADRDTARALRRTADDFEGQLAELQTYFAGPSHPQGTPTIRAIPAEGRQPPIWLLGSTGFSAELAGRLGLPFAFAYHLSAASAANARPALALYRQTFTPSATRARPYSLICVPVLCAKDADEARWLHGSWRLAALRQKAGRPGPVPSPAEAAITAYSTAEQAVIAEATGSHVVGDPATVTAALAGLVAATEADEVMVTTTAFDHETRRASDELLARAASLNPVEALPQVGHP
jgi:luciferase family oxidoreductase group 1